MNPRSEAVGCQAGAALPGVLLVMFWLTGIGGWLVSHSVWDHRMHMVDEETVALSRAAEALAEVMARRLADVPDWHDLLDSGTEIGCPTSTSPLPAAIDLASETSRLQATTNALSRWTGVAHPVWRFIGGCDAESLQGDWRGRGATPWLLAWVANTAGGTGVEPPTQLALHLVAMHPVRGRSTRTVTLRRFPGQMSVRIVAWHPD